MKKNAFTLAEVLITLGIIGVVAAMTLPTVINNIQEKQYKSAFKKQYSVIAQALQLIFAKENILITPQEDGWIKMPYNVCRIGTQLKAIKSGLKCNEVLMSDEYSFDNTSALPKNNNVHWHSAGKWFDKTGKPMYLNGGDTGYSILTFMLPDGTMINFNAGSTVFVDVNGEKKPNTIGKDIFYFFVKDNSFTPVFWLKESGSFVNSSSGADYSTFISKDNYKEDCEKGSGWGCSPMYIID